MSIHFLTRFSRHYVLSAHARPPFCPKFLAMRLRARIVNVLRLRLSFKLLCFAVDPPDSPGDYRKVRNVNYTFTSVDDAYRFNINVTWDPPIYPYKQLDYYDVYWKRRGALFLELLGYGKSYVRYFSLSSFTACLQLSHG